MKHLPQKIGVGLLVATGILGYKERFDLGWIAFGLTGLITAGCAIRNKLGNPTRTVSQWIQDRTDNKLIDYTIGGAIIGFATWQHFTMVVLPDLTRFEVGMMTAFWPLAIGLSIHFFANKD